MSLLAILFEQPCIEIVLTETTFNWQSRLRQNCFRGKMTLKKIDWSGLFIKTGQLDHIKSQPKNNKKKERMNVFYSIGRYCLDHLRRKKGKEPHAGRLAVSCSEYLILFTVKNAIFRIVWPTNMVVVVVVCNLWTNNALKVKFSLAF